MVADMVYADVSDGLVGYWNFDEGEGTMLNDLSGNNYNGTIYGATWSDGVCGSALDFDGVDDYVELPDIDIVPNPITICAWVNIQDNTLSGEHFIFGRTHQTIPGEYYFCLRDNVTPEGPKYVMYFQVVRDAGTAWEVGFTNQPSPTGWHFYCGSWDGVERCANFGEGVNLYIDGVLQTNVGGLGNCGMTLRTGPPLTAIGVYEDKYYNLLHFTADPMDEIRIYNRVLSTDEIQSLYQAGLACLVPQINCVGFEPPMAAGPVTVKKNRALPHKAQLQNAEGYAVTGADITAAPVIQVLYESTPGADPVDVTDDALSAGMGTDGNQFVWTEEGKWQFNLKTSNYTAPGTYTVIMKSGDETEYLIIDPTCQATFVIK